MSFHDYLHERAEESRHNEVLAYLAFLAGAVFFVGGVLETLNLSEPPSWFLIIPYVTNPNAGSVLGLTMMLGGIILVVFGIASGINYSRDRGWYMQEINKANLGGANLTGKQNAKNSRKKKSEKA
jgi:uncharacterized membrane protein YiaA